MILTSQVADGSHAEVVDGSHAEVVDGSQAETSVILDRNSSPSPAPNTPGSRISPGTSVSPSLDLQSCASPLLQQALLELVRLLFQAAFSPLCLNSGGLGTDRIS